MSRYAVGVVALPQGDVYRTHYPWDAEDDKDYSSACNRHAQFRSFAFWLGYDPYNPTAE